MAKLNKNKIMVQTDAKALYELIGYKIGDVTEAKDNDGGQSIFIRADKEIENVVISRDFGIGEDGELYMSQDYVLDIIPEKNY